MNKIQSNWRVLYVKPKHEKKVYASLIKLGIESFLPTIKEVRNWSDRKKIVERCLFPSYVFVNTQNVKNDYQILDIAGVCFFIKFAGEYAKVKDTEINYIKLLLGDKAAKDIAVSNINIFEGETRVINVGPLKGLSCEVLNAKRLNKIVVRLDSIHQNITAIVPAYYFSGAKEQYFTN